MTRANSLPDAIALTRAIHDRDIYARDVLLRDADLAEVSELLAKIVLLLLGKQDRDPGKTLNDWTAYVRNEMARGD